jgi:2,4-dienoyl-CoA reductase-like NADH-dependent reductase (Old Yellow Enzyme family)
MMGGMVLGSPVRIGTAVVRNRLYRAPVLEGAGDGPDAAELYARHFVANARHGVGLVIQGSSCIAPEGRTSPGMTCVDTRAKVLRLAPMVDAVHREGAAIFLQVGHGGLYAMEAWHEPYASTRRGPVLAASPVPWVLRPGFAGVPVHVMTTTEVHTMADRYGDVAAWAREAGYDGVQLGSANAKLLDQFLSPFYNRRTDEFGGSLERRASVLARIRTAVAERAGADYPCTVKVPAERAPFGFRRSSTDDALRLSRLVEEWGFDAVTPVEVSVFPDTTLSRGGVPDSFWTNAGIAQRLRRAAPARRRRAVIKAGAWWGGRRAPFTPVWNRSLFSAVKRAAGIPVLAVGGIRTGREASAIVEDGEADLVGIGRPFYTEPDLAGRILAEDATSGRCRSSNRCVAAQMLGMKGVCYNPDVVKRSSSR